MNNCPRLNGLFLVIIFLLTLNSERLSAQPISSNENRITSKLVISLNGEWLIEKDPLNIGKEKNWWQSPVSGAQKIKVPWILQEVFPAYHGVVWYWHDFVAPRNNYPLGRTLLRFESIDYMGDIWLNNTFMGRHESGDVSFTIDITDVIKTDGPNHLSVRVLNPTNEPIDGMTLKQIPRQARVIPYSAGGEYNCGGITGSVELRLVPIVRVEDLFASANSRSDVIETGLLFGTQMIKSTQQMNDQSGLAIAISSSKTAVSVSTGSVFS